MKSVPRPMRMTRITTRTPDDKLATKGGTRLWTGYQVCKKLITECRRPGGPSPAEKRQSDKATLAWLVAAGETKISIRADFLKR